MCFSFLLCDLANCRIWCIPSGGSVQCMLTDGSWIMQLHVGRAKSKVWLLYSNRDYMLLIYLYAEYIIYICFDRPAVCQRCSCSQVMADEAPFGVEKYLLFNITFLARRASWYSVVVTSKAVRWLRLQHKQDKSWLMSSCCLFPAYLPISWSTKIDCNACDTCEYAVQWSAGTKAVYLQDNECSCVQKSTIVFAHASQKQFLQYSSGVSLLSNYGSTPGLALWAPGHNWSAT